MRDLSAAVSVMMIAKIYIYVLGQNDEKGEKRRETLFDVTEGLPWKSLACSLLFFDTPLIVLYWSPRGG